MRIRNVYLEEDSVNNIHYVAYECYVFYEKGKNHENREQTNIQTRNTSLKLGRKP